MSSFNLISLPRVSFSLNPMTFTENQQGSAVLEKLRQQRETGRFCDVVLVVQGKHYPAHRNILAACSPYFDSILKMHKVVKEQVTVNCPNAEVFELLLNYMYSGSVVIDRLNVTDLLKLANNFLVSKLKNYCAEYLDRYLDVTNALTVRDLAEKYNMPGLSKTASFFVTTNVERIALESEELLDLSVFKFRTLLSDPIFHLQIQTQLLCTVRWCMRNFEERETHLKPILSSCVDLRRLDKRMLANFLDTELRLAFPMPVVSGIHGDHTTTSAYETILFSILETARELDLLSDKYQSIYHSLAVHRTGDVSVYFNSNLLTTSASSSALGPPTTGSATYAAMTENNSFTSLDRMPNVVNTTSTVSTTAPTILSTNNFDKLAATNDFLNHGYSTSQMINSAAVGGPCTNAVMNNSLNINDSTSYEGGEQNMVNSTRINYNVQQTSYPLINIKQEISDFSPLPVRNSNEYDPHPAQSDIIDYSVINREGPSTFVRDALPVVSSNSAPMAMEPLPISEENLQFDENDAAEPDHNQEPNPESLLDANATSNADNNEQKNFQIQS